MKPLALSIGCPAGVGPEVALAGSRAAPAPVLLVGDVELIHATARRMRVQCPRVVRDPGSLRAHEVAVWGGSAALARRVSPGKPNRAAGAAQLAWIDAACDLVRDGRCSALVTGPVSKEAIASSGAAGARSFRGHTEHLAARLGAREVVMAFALDRARRKLATALVTTHLPLAKVARAITRENVAEACFWLARLLADLGQQRATIAVAGLNPHAGESGLLGREEIDVVKPGMQRASARLHRNRIRARLIGPIGAESAFRLAAAGEYDGVVAMYHDQATIACKLMGFGEAVNVTLGLPIVRTSVDHGTAYDLAGTGRASADGMRAAIQLAAELSARRPV
jgi:4-hydroxythreonine-4-phosphate dehydrogenase